MSAPNRKPSYSATLPSFAGIALADILANGVAMIIILIVITMSLKHQQEQERIAEFEEVSVLLSRDIASSVVMNDLPTSAPAVLHDYHNSPLDRILDPRILPIIELHKGFVRDFYSRATFSREAMLQEDNAFDSFIRAMDPIQRARIRIDVYDIDTFYVAMSILRKYGRMPAHWHFIGYDQSDKSQNPAEKKDKEKDEEKMEHEETETETELAEENNNSGSTGETWEHFPDGAQIQAQSDAPQYPFDDLAYDSEQFFASQQQGSGTPQSTAQMANQMFDALVGMMSGGGTGRMPRVVRFRTAKPSSSKSDAEKNSEMLEFDGDSDAKLSVDYIHLLASLFRFMERADQAARNGNYAVLDRFNFQRDIVLPALKIKLPKDPQKAKFFLELAASLHAVPKDTRPLRVEQVINEANRNSLQLTPNKALRQAKLLTNSDQETFGFLPTDARLRINLGLYPAIYKGLSEPLSQANMVLIPEDTVAPQVDRWRVASVISPKQGDYLLAFIYGHINDQGDFVIASDENAVQVEELYTYTFQPPIEFRKQKESFIIFGVLALLLLLGIVRRFRKTG